jgi:inositol polyphosphate 5-phosphatase INPP5B/F
VGNLNQQDYIFIRPLNGSLGPKERISIDFTILLGNTTIRQLAYGKPLDEILVLEIRNGRHIFISLQGEFQRTCFGLPLEILVSFGGKGVRNVNTIPKKETGGGMPDELWRMTDFIMTYGQDCSSIFLERGDEALCKGIRESLDTATEFDQRLVSEGEIGVLSMAETLLRYLDALPTAIVPQEVYHKAIRMGESKGSIMEVLSPVPWINNS